MSTNKAIRLNVREDGSATRAPPWCQPPWIERDEYFGLNLTPPDHQGPAEAFIPNASGRESRVDPGVHIVPVVRDLVGIRPPWTIPARRNAVN